MPRKHRSARERAGPPLPARPLTAAPAWAQAPGLDVRMVTANKPYRCPGCDHAIRPGASHVVVVPADDVRERRHWHTECWRRELRRIGGAPR
jgi:hypothetical protein